MYEGAWSAWLENSVQAGSKDKRRACMYAHGEKQAWEQDAACTREAALGVQAGVACTRQRSLQPQC